MMKKNTMFSSYRGKFPIFKQAISDSLNPRNPLFFLRYFLERDPEKEWENPDQVYHVQIRKAIPTA
jgi:hypothetical protein